VIAFNHLIQLYSRTFSKQCILSSDSIIHQSSCLLRYLISSFDVMNLRLTSLSVI